MKLIQALAVLSKLPASESQAIDIQTLCKRVPGVSVRTMQRYMEQLSGEDAEYRVAPLVRRIEDPAADGTVSATRDDDKPVGRPFRYCLDTSALRQWFMTDHMALNLVLADQAVGASLGQSQRVGSSGLAVAAERRLQHQAPEARRISAYVRIVPDGMGRRAARIDPQVVDAVIEAIATGRQLAFSYGSAAGNQRRWEVSPRGLVAKDGSLYLVGTRDLSHAPTTFALHRIREQEVSSRPVPPLDFDIDRYLEETQNLSHPVRPGPLIDLRLRVEPRTVYHFRERPLWNQVMSEPDATGHVIVTARVTHGMLLVPFLLSMSPGVEVLGPQEVREQMTERVLAAARYYGPPPRASRQVKATKAANEPSPVRQASRKVDG